MKLSGPDHADPYGVIAGDSVMSYLGRVAYTLHTHCSTANLALLMRNTSRDVHHIHSTIHPNVAIPSPIPFLMQDLSAHWESCIRIPGCPGSPSPPTDQNR